MHFPVDGIHPKWSMFIKTVPEEARVSPAMDVHANKQEAVRKDVERAFGALAKKFHVLGRPI